MAHFSSDPTWFPLGSQQQPQHKTQETDLRRDRFARLFVVENNEDFSNVKGQDFLHGQTRQESYCMLCKVSSLGTLICWNDNDWYYTDTFLLVWSCKVTSCVVKLTILMVSGWFNLGRHKPRVSLRFASWTGFTNTNNWEHQVVFPQPPSPTHLLQERSMFQRVFFLGDRGRECFSSDQFRGLKKLKKANKEIWKIAYWWCCFHCFGSQIVSWFLRMSHHCLSQRCPWVSRPNVATTFVFIIII